MVTSVEPDTPGEAARLQPGDRIALVDGEELTRDNLNRLMRPQKTYFELHVLREEVAHLTRQLTTQPRKESSSSHTARSIGMSPSGVW